jgi:hypothetical protein
LALAITSLTKVSSNFRSNKRTRGRPDKRAEMDFALFHFGRRREDEKQNVTTKTSTPINDLRIPRGRLYISTNLNPLPKVRRAVESKVGIQNPIRITRKSTERKEPIRKTVQSSKSFSKRSSNISLKVSLIYGQIEITLKLHTKGNPRGENVTNEVFNGKLQGDKVLMSPELVNPVRSHIETKLRTFF